jgi:hypothetical protein
MRKINPIRLWRVEVVHRNGYQAPYFIIEAKKKDIHAEVKNLNLRLLDFPEKWSYRVVDLEKTFNEKRGKWI